MWRVTFTKTSLTSLPTISAGAYMRYTDDCRSPVASVTVKNAQSGHFRIVMKDHTDYYGIRRRRIRVNWWAPEQTTFRDAAVIDDGQRHTIPDTPLPDGSPTYEGPLCFFGHYWMRGTPRIQHPHAVCLDYSVALDDGALCAYQFRGECAAKRDNLVWVNRS